MKYLILILFTFCITQVNAQTETTYVTDGGLTESTPPTGTTPADWYENLEKYWYYRYKLVNDFMKIGLKAGESIPAMSRQLGDNYNTDCRNRLYVGSDPTNALGHYLKVLAHWRGFSAG